MNSLRTMTTEEHDRPSPLLRPARVEKWQRWGDSRGAEFVVYAPSTREDRWCLRKPDNFGEWFGDNMLTFAGWHFLGYAKPDKVEVGQRWRSPMREYVVESVTTHKEPSERVVDLRCESGRIIPVPLVVFGEPAAKGWEYLGMSESAEEAKQGARNSDLSRYGRLADAMAGPEPLVVPCDPKVVARRANEEAAKRLIENPPEWAYPTAWRCAVLAVFEDWTSANSIEAPFAPTGAATMILRRYQHLRNDGTHHLAAMMLASVGELAPALDLVDAYARGMERPTLLGRPGVKGGISTCDLGVEYE